MHSRIKFLPALLLVGCSVIPSTATTEVCAMIDKSQHEPYEYHPPEFMTFESMQLATDFGGYDFLKGNCRDVLKEPRVPLDWKYRRLPESNIDLPLPPKSVVKEHSIASNGGSSVDEGEPFFSWSVSKIPWNRSTQDFLDSKCAGATEAFTGDKGDFSGSMLLRAKYLSGSTFLENGLEIVKFGGRCTNVTEFLLRQGDTIYEFSTGGDGGRQGYERFERALLNARIGNENP